MNTIININKGYGASSFSVIRALRKMLQVKKIGHLGTLDPLATGVLPVFTGKTTKLIPLFNELDKEYRALFKLGQRTDTFDTEGAMIEESSIESITASMIAQCLEQYEGIQPQLTPAYSAVKYKGIPAYQLARQGKKVERKTKTISIERIKIITLDLPFVEIEIQCSKGTYIRTLVDDIGQHLQVGAHLVALERTAVGPHFSLNKAHRLEEITAFKKCEDFSFCINPVDLLKELHTIHVNAEEQTRLSHGQAVSLRTVQDGFCFEKNPNQLSKAVDSQKTLIAIGHVIAHKNYYQFNPSKIFV